MQVNINNQNQRPSNSQPAGDPNQQMSQQHQQYPKPSKLPWIILAVVVVIVLAAGAYLFRDKLKLAGSGTKDLSGYQAVFLTSGQVYFGKLSNINKDYVRLTDVYYLQVSQQLQQTGTSSQATPNGQPATGQPISQQPAQDQPAQAQLSLVKLGKELHGPADDMEISRAQILFFENLKNDGEVAKAIQKFKAGEQ